MKARCRPRPRRCCSNSCDSGGLVAGDPVRLDHSPGEKNSIRPPTMVCRAVPTRVFAPVPMRAVVGRRSPEPAADPPRLAGRSHGRWFAGRRFVAAAPSSERAARRAPLEHRGISQRTRVVRLASLHDTHILRPKGSGAQECEVRGAGASCCSGSGRPTRRPYGRRRSPRRSVTDRAACRPRRTRQPRWSSTARRATRCRARSASRPDR